MISDTNLPGLPVDQRCHCGELAERPVLHAVEGAIVIVHPCPVHCCELRQFSHWLRPMVDTDVISLPTLTSYENRGFEY